MTTSTNGALSWTEPAQISSSSWGYTNTVFPSNYGGMAAVGNAGGYDFWPTWIAQSGTHDTVVTAEWAP